MALIKECTAKNGAPVRYWRVDMISKNRGRRQISFAFMGYFSEEVAAKSPDAFIMCQGADQLLIDPNEEIYKEYFDEKGVKFKDIETACYEYAKAHMEFFAGAVDDAEYINDTLGAGSVPA